jgi:long-chain acyl-CoA synthetase
MRRERTPSMPEDRVYAPALEFRTIPELFDRLTEKYARDPQPALMHKVGGAYQGISYTELAELVHRFSAGLSALGVRRGDRIALISENRPEYVVADMGMVRLGAVNVSLYPTLSAKQVRYILNDAGVQFALVSNPLHLKKVLGIAGDVPNLRKIVVFSDKAPTENPCVISYASVLEMGVNQLRKDAETGGTPEQEINPDDLLTLIYTSGTTGDPKGVMLTHRNMAENIKASAVCIPLTHKDRVLSFLPLSHSYERMAGYYTAMACGATIAYAESAETLRENLIEARPTVVMMVPRAFERFHNRLMRHMAQQSRARQSIFQWGINMGRVYVEARKRGKLSLNLKFYQEIADRLVFRKIRSRLGGRIRFLASGGAALAPELAEFFEAVGIAIIEGYGMTESSPVISFNRIDDYEFGTVGKPIPGVGVKIAPDGEILARGPNIMKGYWNDPVSTAQVIDTEGWLHTGDVGCFNDRGFLVITDRKKHLFVTSGGKNIAPQIIERSFLQSDLIDQFVLIGEGRMFLTALIVPSFDRVGELARSMNLTVTNHEDLAKKEEIHKLFENEIARIQTNVANYERVRKFTLLELPLTIENGEITPTLKVCRKVVEARFKDQIDKMYQGFT